MAELFITQVGVYAELEPVDISESVLSSIVSMWEMDETEGNRNDETNRHPLIAYNSPGYTTGVIGNAVQFDAANSTYLQTDVHADFAAGNQNWTFWLWFKPDFDGEQTLAGGYPNLTWTLTTDGDPTDQLIARLYDDVGALDTELIVAVPDTGWHLATSIYNSTTTTLELIIDNGDSASDTITGTLLSPSSNAIRLGMNPASNAAADNGAWASGAANANDNAAFYNDKKGKKHKDLTGESYTTQSVAQLSIGISMV